VTLALKNISEAMLETTQNQVEVQKWERDAQEIEAKAHGEKVPLIIPGFTLFTSATSTSRVG
jgi:hypothetical protein